MSGETVHAVEGIRLAATASGSRYRDRDDLCLIEIAPQTNCACLFTTNKFRAAPVTVAEEHLGRTNTRYLVINAGNANAGTGAAGEREARAVCAAVARAGDCEAEAVLPFSTGVIGELLDSSKLTAAVPALFRDLDAEAWSRAAAAIMTTDTRPKVRSVRAPVGDETVAVTGIAKGSGMIKPDMATMLAYVATDAAVDKSILPAFTKELADRSFNRITVDGDTSTNDAFVFMATGCCGGAPIKSSSDPRYAALFEAAAGVCDELAKDIVRDGEGATKFVTVRVSGGATDEDCRKVAYAVAESPLVKTALFASDPNWGRILAAIGRAGATELDINEVSIDIGDCAIVRAGAPVDGYDERQAAAVMGEAAVEINIGIGGGPCTLVVWTCDFSYDYVKINAEYRS